MSTCIAQSKCAMPVRALIFFGPGCVSMLRRPLGGIMCCLWTSTLSIVVGIVPTMATMCVLATSQTCLRLVVQMLVRTEFRREPILSVEFRWYVLYASLLTHSLKVTLWDRSSSPSINSSAVRKLIGHRLYSMYLYILAFLGSIGQPSLRVGRSHMLLFAQLECLKGR
jgi:hypothetical protein